MVFVLLDKVKSFDISKKISFDMSNEKATE